VVYNRIEFITLKNRDFTGIATSQVTTSTATANRLLGSITPHDEQKNQTPLQFSVEWTNIYKLGPHFRASFLTLQGRITQKGASSVSDSSPSHFALFFLRESQFRISTKHFQRMWLRITKKKYVWLGESRACQTSVGISTPIEFTTLNDWFPATRDEMNDFCQQGMKWNEKGVPNNFLLALHVD